jgi:hypothetical protein
MRKRLSKFSLRGRSVLFLSNLALFPRQCGKHRQLIDCACLQRFTFTAEMIAKPIGISLAEISSHPRENLQALRELPVTLFTVTVN